MNIVLEDASERIFHGDLYAEKKLGNLVIKGDTIQVAGVLVRACCCTCPSLFPPSALSSSPLACPTQPLQEARPTQKLADFETLQKAKREAEEAAGVRKVEEADI